MIILGTNSIKDTGYNVANSVRFGVDTYMHKVFSSDNEKNTWTFSLWFKRGKKGSTQRMMTHNGATSGKFFYLRWESNEQLHFHIGMSDGNFAGFDTTQVFRDHSAWYHIVCAVDTTQGTEANRVKIYVNGSQVTAFGTANYPAQNTTASIGRTDTPMVVGALYGSGFGITSGSPQEFYDGYLAEVCFIDGSQLAPDQFGEFDSDSAIWRPIDVSGLSFGTEGFYLDFEASGNLGNDANGGTDLTEVNLAATDQSTDTCTNNFPVINPLDNNYAGGTFAEGNLQITTRDTGYSYNTATFGVATGKWYWEVKWSAQNTGSTNQVLIGIAKRNVVSTTVWLGSVAWTFAYEGSSGHVKVSDGNATNSTSTTYSVGDIISVALDLDNNKIHFAKNGTYTNSSDAAGNSGGVTITAPDSTSGDSGFYFPAFGDGNNNLVETGQFNFGSPIHSISSGNADANGYGNFEYAVPSGYYSICTKNIAEFT